MARKRRGRGEGGVYRRADGTWAGIVSLGYGPDGKRRRKFVYGATKQEALEKILSAIRRVLSGAIYVSDRLAAKMLQQQVRGQSDINESPVKGLSDRELEVFQLIGQWKKTRDIADELHLSIKTIEYYREQIKRKLNLKNAGELTQYATSWVQREIPT